MDHVVPRTAKVGTNDHIYTSVGEKGSQESQTAMHTSAKPSLFARLQDGWTAEILSCALSVAALAGLMAALKYFDGRVVTEMPLKISINTLVAVIAAVVKTALLLPVAEGTWRRAYLG